MERQKAEDAERSGEDKKITDGMGNGQKNGEELLKNGQKEAERLKKEKAAEEDKDSQQEHEERIRKQMYDLVSS